LQTQVHEVLASQNIILLKKKKRLFLLYEHQIETRYKTSRAFEEEEAAPPIDAINPKRRKQKIPSFSLV